MGQPSADVNGQNSRRQPRYLRKFPFNPQVAKYINGLMQGIVLENIWGIVQWFQLSVISPWFTVFLLQPFAVTTSKKLEVWLSQKLLSLPPGTPMSVAQIFFQLPGSEAG